MVQRFIYKNLIWIFTAEDCGGAIKENKIGIFMGSEQESYNFGRRTIDIHILN
jgi:3D (Asp-Asp-Asp) domain-containing protein